MGSKLHKEEMPINLFSFSYYSFPGILSFNFSNQFIKYV